MKTRIICLLIIALMLVPGVSSGGESPVQTAEALRAQADGDLAVGDFASAMAALDQLLALDPSSEEAWLDAARVRLKLLELAYGDMSAFLAEVLTKAPDPYALFESTRNAYDALGLDLIIPFLSDVKSSGNANTTGISSGNLTNQLSAFGFWQGGLLSNQGEWIYFVTPDQGFALYKARNDGAEVVNLGVDSACFLNVIGDWIYYCNLADNASVYKVRTDGSGRTKLTDEGCESVSVSDGWIYYINGNDEWRLYRVKDDGSDRTLLSSSAVRLPYVYNGFVYYMDDRKDGFWRVPASGGDPQQLSGQSVQQYVIHNDMIYYLNAAYNRVGVWKMSLDGDDPAPLIDFQGKASTFNISGNSMIISCGDFLYVYDLASLRLIAQIDAWTESVCTAGTDWVYYADGNTGFSCRRFNLSTGEIQRFVSETLDWEWVDTVRMNEVDPNAVSATGYDPAQYEELTVGSSGPKVAELKRRMFELGYFSKSTTNETYTEVTARYVAEFEQVNGLPVDGIADPEMLALFYSDAAKPKPKQ